MARGTILVTILPSADVDLARWLLHLWGVPFTEEPHAPVFHILALRRRGAGRQDSPLLIHRGETFGGIEKIVAALDGSAPSGRRLVPDAALAPDLNTDVMDLQHSLRWELGMGTVRWAYYHFLQDRALVWDSFTRGVPAWERAVLSMGGFGAVKRRLEEALDLGPANAAAALDAVTRGFDEVEARLADGRAFLCGDALSLADLAFATSAGPMILARGYGGHLPPPDRCPPDVQAVIRALRTRPAGAFAQRLYDDWRSA